MPVRRKNVDLMRLKRTAKRNKFFECLSLPCVQYLMIFLLWGLLLLINQSTEMRFEYFWPGWLFICSTHDSLKYQGLQYTMFFVIIVLTTDLLFFFLFPPSWIYFCGSAYVWIYLLWHTDQGLCFLTLTFCLTFVYFELGFQSRDVKFNHSIYFFRPFAAHSMGYPVVCMGFSIMRYLEVRHRKNRTLNVRRQNYLYFRILRDAVPVSLLTDFTNGTCPTYLPHYEFDTQNSKNADGGDCNLSWSIFLFSQLASSCFSRLGQWCPSYPLPLDHELCNGGLTNCHALCPRSSVRAGGGGQFLGCTATSDLTSLDCADSHLITSSSGSAARPASAGRTRLVPTPCEAVAPAAGGSGGGGPVHQGHIASGGPFTRQLGGWKTAAQPTPQSTVASVNNPTGTSTRCTKDNPTLRLENTIRRLKNDVQSMRAVESQLRGQLTNLESENLLHQQSLSEQRQANEAMAGRISKLNSRRGSERASLLSLEQSLAEEKRLYSAVHEQLAAIEAQLSPLSSTTAVTLVPAACMDQKSLVVGAEKAVQTTTTNESGSNSIPGETVVTPRFRVASQPDRVLRESETGCCQRRRVLESELRSVLQQRQQEGSETPICDAPTKVRGKTSGKATAIAAGGTARGQRTNRGDESGQPITSTLPTTSGGGGAGRSSQLQCQQILLETYIQTASKEHARLESKLKEENWMKQELLTEFHKSVGEITNLNHTLKQRESQITELSQKVEQYEQYLSSRMAGYRVRTAFGRSVGSQNPTTALTATTSSWLPLPTCSVPGPQSHLRVKPAGYTSTDICHPLLSSVSSPPFNLAPVNGPNSTTSAGYPPDDLSSLVPLPSICEQQSGQESIGRRTSVTAADNGVGYLRLAGMAELCSNGGTLFDDLQLGLVCANTGQQASTTDFLTSSLTTLAGSPVGAGTVVVKGRRALHRPSVTLTDEVTMPTDSTGSSHLQTESH